MKSSHKTRLFVITTVSVGLVLAIVFVSIVFGVRQKVLAHKEAEMRLAVRTHPSLHASSVSVDAFRTTYPGYSIAIYNQEGQELQRSGPIALEPILGFQDHGSFVMLGERESGLQVVLGSGWTLAERGLDDLAVILGALWLPLTFLVGAATWLGAQSVFRHLEGLSQQAAAISGSNLNERIAIQDRAEFGAFADQLNLMLDRIHETVLREEQFASDAAHELRTPLAILRTRIETTLLRERNPVEYIASYNAMLTEIERLSLIVESLLQSARGQSKSAEVIDLEPVVRQAAADWTEVFTEKDIRLEVNAQKVRSRILPEDVRIVLDNLLANARRFSPAGATVTVTLERINGEAVLSVQDQGPGIQPQLREKIFERFVRADDNRNRESGGAGIGLAVCRRIVASRDGTIRIKPTDEGTCVEVKLPVAD